MTHRSLIGAPQFVHEGQKELNTADFELRALKTSPRTYVSNRAVIGSRFTVFLALHYKVCLVQLPRMQQFRIYQL